MSRETDKALGGRRLGIVVGVGSLYRRLKRRVGKNGREEVHVTGGTGLEDDTRKDTHISLTTLFLA